MDRTILHCDLNNFYASVECLSKPELKQVPMAVCGDVDSRRGIILAKNQIAKGYGIVTAETVWQAQKKCKDLVLVPPHFDQYQKFSKIVRKIFDRYTDMVEPFGIDESWLDVTGSIQLFGTGIEIADQLRETIKHEVGLTVSVGVSFNKIFAKLGSDYKKPDATTVISRENFKEIVFPLPVSALLFVGKSAATYLDSLNIKTIGDLAMSDKQVLIDRMGKGGKTIHDYANGLDKSPVQRTDDVHEAKSIGKGLTFKRNLVGMEDIKTGLLPLAESVATRLRRHRLKCTTVQVTIKNPQFKTIHRQKKLNMPTNITNEIYNTAINIMNESWSMTAPIRMLTITGANLVDEKVSEQISFFGEQVDKRRKKSESIEHIIDNIRDKYGKQSISIGATIDNELTSRDPRDDDGYT